MHERRQAARFTYQSTVRYCSSSDFSPREGYATNLSECGGGLLLREPHESGQRVTVNVLTHREAVPLAITGSVRWAADRRLNGHGFPVGVEWLPVEGSTQQRLQELLIELAEESALPTGRRSTVQWARAVVTGLVGGGLVSGVLWAGRRWQEQASLERLLTHQNATITQLQREVSGLRDALREADAHLLATSSEVSRLSDQAGQLEGTTQTFHQSLAELQASYVQIRQQREALIQRVVSLEQERLQLIRRSVPARGVERAVRDAIAASSRRSRTNRPSPLRPATWIRVQQPESGVSADPASR